MPKPLPDQSSRGYEQIGDINWPPDADEQHVPAKQLRCAVDALRDLVERQYDYPKHSWFEAFEKAKVTLAATSAALDEQSAKTEGS